MPRLAIAVLAVALMAAGCGSSSDQGSPSACLAPASAYLRALGDAPGEVRLTDDTPISACVAPDASGGELEAAGRSVIEAATRLNAAARRDPSGPATVRLGYLDGAVHRGTSEEGINADLIRRLDAAARFNPGGGSPGASFERAFGKGYAAGEASG